MRGEIAVRPVAWAGLAIVGTVAAVVAAVFLLLDLWNTDAGADRTGGASPPAVPGPALQDAPQLDLRAYREEKQRLLESTAWVDAQHGIARIPIAQAMALLAASAASAPAQGAKP